MTIMASIFIVLFVLFARVLCINFPYESIQLTEADIGNFSAIAFEDEGSANPINAAGCKTFPGSPEWPLDEEWQRLNTSLDGALLRPEPAAAACYDGPSKDAAKCRYLLSTARTNRFYIDDPLTVLTEWPQGDTCFATSNPTGNCTRGGFPDYVVNVTTVRQIQIAVNFARNKNIRLIIKNTGHEFLGRSAGAGSISVWTHFLKNFEYLPEHKQTGYADQAARVAAGLEAWELFPYMEQYNTTVVIPSGKSVGAYGGWFSGGGHGVLASLYGLGSDQPLTMQVVTANGKFVTASPEENEDLYYAIRGGGASTYGIVTSLIVKAYPPTYVTGSSLSFQSGRNITAFWEGVKLFFHYGKTITAAGGTTYNYVNPVPGSSTAYTFRTTFELPNLSKDQTFELLQPLFDSLNAVGVSARNPQPSASTQWGTILNGIGDTPGNSRFSSRLFPRKNWDDAALWNDTFAAIREVTEAGYTFHGIHMAPSLAVGGYPGSSGVNPAFRETLMHADIFDFAGVRGLTPQAVRDAHTRLNFYTDKLRAATPGAGAYMNEADLEEPGWQQSFFGDKYETLSGIKKKWDPRGVFWAPGTVGSEGWAVEESEDDGLPTQNGRLCRVDA